MFELQNVFESAVTANLFVYASLICLAISAAAAMLMVSKPQPAAAKASYAN